MLQLMRIIGFVFILQLIVQFSGNAQKPSIKSKNIDTSYTLYSALESTKKTNPEAKPVVLLSTKNIIEQKNRVYCVIGNRKLVTDVFYPANMSKNKRTAVIIVHGGGWRSGNKSLHHNLAQQLAQKEYVTFTPEYRLSPEALYPAAVYDLKATIRWVRSQSSSYNIDTNKIVIVGHSAGGQLAALVGATNGNTTFEFNTCNTPYSSSVNAVVDMDGILAFIHSESGEGDDSKKRSAATSWFGISKIENEQLWKEGSPLSHIGPSMPPTLFINSSIERMHAGRDDFMRIMNHYKIYNELLTFEGAPHSFPLFDPWFTPTLTAIDNFLRKVFTVTKTASYKTIIVAKDGSGHYKSMQEALNAVPLNNQQPITIYIKNGIYKEKLKLDSTKNYVTLIGEDKYATILSYNDHTGKLSPNGDTINTYTSHSFLQAANDFNAKNITFQNDAGFTAGQAVAIQILGDRSSFINCRFIGNQDVLFPSREKTRQYFENCYIEGTTDFIFGPSTAWFEKCHIHSKKNSHVTAASTPQMQQFGYVFNESILTGDTSLRNVSLGRPWRPYASVTYINCWIGNHITPQGWDNWRNPANEATARYAEYNNFGPGASPNMRARWIKQLTAEEAKKINLHQVLSNWNPIARNRF